MPAVELLESDAIAGLLQQRDDSTAALVDRQDTVPDAVGYANDRASALLVDRDKESGREGQNATKEVPVGKTESERISGAVGKPESTRRAAFTAHRSKPSPVRGR